MLIRLLPARLLQIGDCIEIDNTGSGQYGFVTAILNDKTVEVSEARDAAKIRKLFREDGFQIMWTVQMQAFARRKKNEGVCIESETHKLAFGDYVKSASVTTSEKPTPRGIYGFVTELRVFENYEEINVYWETNSTTTLRMPPDSVDLVATVQELDNSNHERAMEWVKALEAERKVLWGNKKKLSQEEEELDRILKDTDYL